jgi:hypothetical protein
MKEPEKQGSHDGACGFYSIGNAVAIVCPRIRRHLDDVFFKMFKDYLNKYDGSHLFEGMGRNLLNDVLKTISDYLSKEYDLNLSIYRPFWNETAINLGQWRDYLLSHFLNDNSKRAAIIIYEYCKDNIEESYAHWTVIKSATTKSLHTFDSNNERKYIPFSLCRIWDGKERHKGRPYKIDTTASFLLSSD